MRAGSDVSPFTPAHLAKIDAVCASVFAFIVGKA